MTNELTTTDRITREDLLEFIGQVTLTNKSNKAMKAIRGRFRRTIIPAFKTIDEFYRADIQAFARNNPHQVGVDGAHVWKEAKDWIYRIRKEQETAQEKAAQEEAQAEVIRELEDPWISKKELERIMNLVVVCELPGIRYRKLQAFLESIREPGQGAA